MGTNDQIMQRGKLMVTRFQRSILVTLTLTLVIDILFEKLTRQIGD